MRIFELGDGTPEVAVVGSVHGDEPCGARAIERFVADDPTVERPVKLVIANEEALAEDARYLEADLNRVFPGDATASAHERRLAADLAREIRGCTTLSIHSTQSYARPFALVDQVGAVARAICPHLPADALVETAGFNDGGLVQHPHTVEVEAGLQGTEEAADNAYWLLRAFLTATGVTPAPVASDLEDGEATVALQAREADEIPVFRLRERITKASAETYEVFVQNFERVEAGETFAAADGDALVADDPFYPVLLSAYGYEDMFGFAADHVGTLGGDATAESEVEAR